MPAKDFSRRSFLRLTAAATLLPLAPLGAAAAIGPAFLAACRMPDGTYAVAELDGAGHLTRTFPLPGRGHGFAVSADGRRAVAFARYPLTFAAGFAVGGNTAPVLFAAPPGRHFYGHGIFVDGDRLVLATENDFDNARGVIGVYDVAAGYRRIGELETGGVGPHEMILMPDGVTVAVANGGIETHPDFGDTRLNLATMAPSLAFIDSRTGDLLARHALDPALHQLSIRHIAVDAAGKVWFGCQYQGPTSDLPAVVGFASPDETPRLIGDPTLGAALRYDVTSVAAAGDGQVIAVSSPLAGTIGYIDLTGRVLGAVALKSGSGLAALDDHAWLATSGDGVTAALRPQTEPLVLATADLAFDNHLTRAHG